MGHQPKFTLLDEAGQPLGSELAGALNGLIPRLVRQYPALRDESLLVGALESAGRKISNRERRSGPIEKLQAYAWATLQNCAKSQLRLGRARLSQKLLKTGAHSTFVDAVPASTGTPAQIENAIFLREVWSYLTVEERLLCIRKELGYTSEEIARTRGGSAAAVDTLLSRARQKIRQLFSADVQQASDGPGRSAAHSPEQHGAGAADGGNDDDE